MPKYSILLPVRNGEKYVENCINTVLVSTYNDYELIVSDNYSTDNTALVLARINHSNLKKIRPIKVLSMTSHWEWLVSQASGEWLIILGVDDGIMPYFFLLADKLTDIALKKRVRSIMSRRVYYFWPGCESIYSDAVVSFRGSHRILFRNSIKEMIRSLIGDSCYFDLPQMYSNSLFHRTLILDVIKKQGRLFTSIIPDANLAAIVCSLEKKFLFSDMALGWVGTSPASNGFAHGLVNSGNLDTSVVERVMDFKTLNGKSNLSFNMRAGIMKMANVHLLFWEALLSCRKLQNYKVSSLLDDKTIIRKILSMEYSLIDKSTDMQKIDNLKVISGNESIPWREVCNTRKVSILNLLIMFLSYTNQVIGSLIRFVNKFFTKPKNEVNLNVVSENGKWMPMVEANNLVKDEFFKTGSYK